MGVTMSDYEELSFILQILDARLALRWDNQP